MGDGSGGEGKFTVFQTTPLARTLTEKKNWVKEKFSAERGTASQKRVVRTDSAERRRLKKSNGERQSEKRRKNAQRKKTLGHPTEIRGGN